MLGVSPSILGTDVKQEILVLAVDGGTLLRSKETFLVL